MKNKTHAQVVDSESNFFSEQREMPIKLNDNVEYNFKEFVNIFKPLLNYMKVSGMWPYRINVINERDVEFVTQKCSFVFIYSIALPLLYWANTIRLLIFTSTNYNVFRIDTLLMIASLLLFLFLTLINNILLLSSTRHYCQLLRHWWQVTQVFTTPGNNVTQLKRFLWMTVTGMVFASVFNTFTISVSVKLLDQDEELLHMLLWPSSLHSRSKPVKTIVLHASLILSSYATYSWLFLPTVTWIILSIFLQKDFEEVTSALRKKVTPWQRRGFINSFENNICQEEIPTMRNLRLQHQQLWNTVKLADNILCTSILVTIITIISFLTCFLYMLIYVTEIFESVGAAIAFLTFAMLVMLAMLNGIAFIGGNIHDKVRLT